MLLHSFTNDTGLDISSIVYVDGGGNKIGKAYDYKDNLSGVRKAAAYTKEFIESTIESIGKSKPVQYAALALGAVPFLLAISNSYAEELGVINKVKGTNQPVKYGKVYLLENSAPIDSLILDINGAGTFRNVSTPVEKEKEYSFRISNPYPNPSEGSVNIDVEMPNAAADGFRGDNSGKSMKFAIYDAMGRKVKELKTEHEPGIHSIVWDGTNDRNERAASGIYLMKAETPSGSAAVKFAYVKGGTSLGSFSNVPGNVLETNEIRSDGSRWAKTVYEPRKSAATYQLHFDNSDTTKPKIKPWTTDSFAFAESKDTTVYSEKLPVSVSGIVLDAYTMSPVPGAKVKVNYVNANKRDSATTDAAGNYSVTFEPADADYNEFGIEASKPGWYVYREWPNKREDYLQTRRWPNSKANELIDTLYIFEPFTEAHPPAVDSVFMPWANRWIKTSELKDGLEYIKFMHRSEDLNDLNYTRIRHWRTADLPIKVCMDTTARIVYDTVHSIRYVFSTPTATAKKLTRDAMNMSNSHFEKNKLIEVPDISDSRVQIGYVDPWPSGRIVFKQENNYIYSYPLKYYLYFNQDSAGVVFFDERMALHDLGHVAWCSPIHSPFHNHHISDNPQYDFSPFEVRAITILYNLPNTVTSSDPLIVKKYLLRKD